MTDANRRAFLQYLAACGVATSAGLMANRAAGASAAHVVVIGGGTGGATAAKYLKIGAPDLRVTMIEATPVYHRCYGSSEVLTGAVPFEDIAITYDALRDKYGVEVVIDTVVGVDPDTRRVALKSGAELGYDRLIVSPGLDFVFEDESGAPVAEGYTPEVAAGPMPHAWKAGPQTLLLKRQIDAMPEDGTAIIVPPPLPYRCPPGPYERGSLLVEMFQAKKPRAKVLILDLKDGFTMDQAFMLAWNRLYGYAIPARKMAGMPDNLRAPVADAPIAWVSGEEGGKVTAVDPVAMTVTTEAGETIRGDVIKFIPPQKAAALAYRMDLVEGRWCPIDRVTMESTRHANIHVIGDSCMADEMPKSGYAANTQAKVAAAQIILLLAGKEPVEPAWSNVCFSRIADEYGISIADIFRLDRQSDRIAMVPESGGISPLSTSHQMNRLEAFYQSAWLENFVADSFG